MGFIRIDGTSTNVDDLHRFIYFKLSFLLEIEHNSIISGSNSLVFLVRSAKYRRGCSISSFLSAKYILSTRDSRGLVQCKSGTIRGDFFSSSILIVGIERPLRRSLNQRCSYKASAKVMSSRTLEDKKGGQAIPLPKLGNSSTSLHVRGKSGWLP